MGPAAADITPPRVSVVIIFLNAAAFLEAAIASVVAQSFTDWELVLVDDGSSDRSSELAKRAAGQRPGQVRTLEHPGHANLGTSASRNLGLREAAGEMLLYLDGDDILFVDTLQTLSRMLDAAPDAAAAFGSTLWWYWDARFAHQTDNVQTYGRWVGRIDPPHLLTEMTRTEHVHPANCSSLFRRDALLALGGFEAAFTGMYEDTVLLAKVLLRHAVVVTNEVLSAYRMHADSQCHRAAAEGSYSLHGPSDSRTRYLRWLARYVRDGRCTNTHLRLMIKRELWASDRPGLSKLVGSREARAVRQLGKAMLRRIGRNRRQDEGPAPIDQDEDADPGATALASLAHALDVQGAGTEADAVRRRIQRRRGSPDGATLAVAPAGLG